MSLKAFDIVPVLDRVSLPNEKSKSLVCVSYEDLVIFLQFFNNQTWKTCTDSCYM